MALALHPAAILRRLLQHSIFTCTAPACAAALSWPAPQLCTQCSLLTSPCAPQLPVQPRLLGLPPSWARKSGAEEREAARLQTLLVGCSCASVCLRNCGCSAVVRYVLLLLLLLLLLLQTSCCLQSMVRRPPLQSLLRLQESGLTTANIRTWNHPACCHLCCNGIPLPCPL